MRELTGNERYEIKAMAFRYMTGHMAPGKDAASESYPAPFEERTKVWEQWLRDYGQCTQAMLSAFEYVMCEENEDE